MISAIELSADVGLVAVGLLTTNILLGLLISSGYNPVRHWPRQRIKLFTLHNWTGYTAVRYVARAVRYVARAHRLRSASL